jgi:hypothetical protein
MALAAGDESESWCAMLGQRRRQQFDMEPE